MLRSTLLYFGWFLILWKIINLIHINHLIWLMIPCDDTYVSLYHVLYVSFWNKRRQLNRCESFVFFARTYECRSYIINYSFANGMPRICHPRWRCMWEHLAFVLSEIDWTHPYLAQRRTYPTAILPHLIYLQCTPCSSSLFCINFVL